MSIPHYQQKKVHTFSLLDGNANLKTMGLEIFRGATGQLPHRKAKQGSLCWLTICTWGLRSGHWYQMHQVVDGSERYGRGIAGQPLVIVGHNERIAWGMTNVYVDETDFT